MEIIPFFTIIFITFFMTSITIFSLNFGFGKNALNLTDPFEEHEK